MCACVFGTGSKFPQYLLYRSPHRAELYTIWLHGSGGNVAAKEPSDGWLMAFNFDFLSGVYWFRDV